MLKKKKKSYQDCLCGTGIVPNNYYIQFFLYPTERAIAKRLICASDGLWGNERNADVTDLLLFRSDDAQTRATLAPSGLPACLPACHPAGDLGRATSLLEKDSTSHMCVYVYFFFLLPKHSG